MRRVGWVGNRTAVAATAQAANSVSVSPVSAFHRSLLALQRMLARMTDRAPPREPTPAASAAPAAHVPYGPERWRRRGRPFRFAAVIVALAGIVFIVAVIFWSGFVLGALSGGQHGDRGGRGYRDESMSTRSAPESAPAIIVAA